ncbi:MAG: phage holin family protein [Frankiales bacterium]|nr:phage holin family protein [Frankiales bacterium]
MTRAKTATDPYPSTTPRRRPSTDASVGELVHGISEDLSALIHQELALAKAELREEVVKAGKGAGLVGATGYAGHMVLLFGTFALVFGLGQLTGIGWACLIVTALWAAAGAVLASAGRKQLRGVHPTPDLTLTTLKEDAQWARHPRS